MTAITKTLMTISLCCAIFATLVSVPASAEDNNYKIGVVNMQQVMEKYEKRKSKYEELQKKVDTLQKGIDARSEKIKGMKDDYEKRKKDLTAAQLVELETKIKADYSDYQNELTKSQQEIDAMENLVLGEVLKDIQEAIKSVAEAGNYHLVLNSGGGPRDAVLYASSTIDMTSKIIEHLNK